MSGAAEGQGAPVRVKICGVTSAEDARAAVAAGADMIGLNFYPRSKRFIALERAREIVTALPSIATMSVPCAGGTMPASEVRVSSTIPASRGPSRSRIAAQRSGSA